MIWGENFTVEQERQNFGARMPMHLCLGGVTGAKAIEVKVCEETLTGASLSTSVVLAFQHYSILRVAKNYYGGLGTSVQLFDLLTGSQEPHRTSQLGR